MFVVLFVLWVVFNGKLNLEIALFGVVLAGAVYAFSCAFLGCTPKKEWAVVKRLPKVIAYLWLLLCEIAKSNLALLRVVYGEKIELKPQLVTFQTPLKGNLKSILADCITVTPGTITVHSEGDSLTVHCLDASFADGIENTTFQQKLLEMSGEVSK